jgi:hypothetical protein
MPNRYEENRERFEGARGQGGPGDQERNWRNRGREHNERSDWGNRESNDPGFRGRGDEGGYGSYGQGTGNYRNPWQGEQGQGERRPWGQEGQYGNRQFEDTRRFDDRSNLGRGYDDRNYDDESWERGYQSTPRNQGSQEDMRRADWDRSRGRRMTMSYPRQDEWSQGHGISSGLGGAENSEYTGYPQSGSYYGGQGQFGGGLSQYGDQGRHAGRGPKGYKRADERIKEDVNERLTHDPHIDASEVEVEVKNGEVTLTGTVDSRQNKRRAEDVIENVSGVSEIHNQLRVQSRQEATGGGAQAGASSGKQSSHSNKL